MLGQWIIMPPVGLVDLLVGPVDPVGLVGLVDPVGLADPASPINEPLPRILGVGNPLVVVLGPNASGVVGSASLFVLVPLTRTTSGP